MIKIIEVWLHFSTTETSIHIFGTFYLLSFDVTKRIKFRATKIPRVFEELWRENIRSHVVGELRSGFHCNKLGRTFHKNCSKLVNIKNTNCQLPLQWHRNGLKSTFLFKLSIRRWLYLTKPTNRNEFWWRKKPEDIFKWSLLQKCRYVLSMCACAHFWGKIDRSRNRKRGIEKID